MRLIRGLIGKLWKFGAVCAAESDFRARGIIFGSTKEVVCWSEVGNLTDWTPSADAGSVSIDDFIAGLKATKH